MDTFIDVDECSLSNGGCDQLCVNIEGSFQCRCQQGFILDSEKRTCRGNNDHFNILKKDSRPR